VDIFLEMARPYAVRGMRAFARAMMERWAEGERQEEGRIDSETDAVQIITFHSAKGLEWPVVIPINAMSESHNGAGIIFDRKDETVHVRR